MIAPAYSLLYRAVLNRQMALSVSLLLGAGLVVVLSGRADLSTALLRGWLVAFAVASAIPVGSTVLLMIHQLTGGRWGLATSPVLRPAAALMPLVLFASLPIIFAQPQIYPWAANPSLIPDDVARWYLNELWFGLLSLLALIGWSVLGLIFAAGSGSAVLAALGLTFFGLTISLVAVDWYLSLDPQYVSSAFAAMIAIQQIMAALAFTTLFAPFPIGRKSAGDLGGLMIATLLGVVYLGYMSFVVAWYGDLPDKATWYLMRSSRTWTAVLVIAFGVGAVAPFAMLLRKPVRDSRTGLRIAGVLLLFGTALHFAWLLIPAFDNPLLVAVSAIAALLLAAVVAVAGTKGLSPRLDARLAK